MRLYARTEHHSTGMMIDSGVGRYLFVSSLILALLALLALFSIEAWMKLDVVLPFWICFCGGEASQGSIGVSPAGVISL